MERSLERAKGRLFSSLREKLRSEKVINAMERVPRERFVPSESRSMAYLDLPLAIGEGQTISQPYIVAVMVDALALQGHEKVLEVGTGSGYQAAILSLLCPRGRVITVELLPVLAQQARQSLRSMGCSNVEVYDAGDTLGFKDEAPFDAIIVAAASPKLPDSLVSQLVLGGRLVVPVGALDQQELALAIRTDEGLSVRMMGSCRFVPLIGREAFPHPQ